MNQPVPEYAVRQERDQRQSQHQAEHQAQAQGHRKPKRRESWLSELFD